MANRIRGYTNKVQRPGLIQNQGFLTYVRPWRSAGKVGKVSCRQASALGGSADLFAQRLPLGEAPGARFLTALLTLS
ncbi:MAG: hypothetical protein ACYT04_55755 [Nostoc sp.]